MQYISLFARLKTQQLRGLARTFGQHSKLKIMVLSMFAVTFWLGMFTLFVKGIEFVDRTVTSDISTYIDNYLFSLFFFSLFLMLSFSNGIIGYTAMFRNRESAFLLTQPVPPVVIYLYKLVESLVFSSWAFLFIGTPVLLAFGVMRGAHWVYYPATLVLFVPFIMLPAALGNGVTLLVVRYMPRHKRWVVIALLILLGLGGYAAYSSLYQVTQGASLFSSIGMYQVFSRLEFLQNPLLPSYWMSQGVLLTAKGELREAGFYTLVLVSNGLFMTYLSALLGWRQLVKAFNLSHSYGGARRRVRTRVVRALLDGLLFFMPSRTRMFLEKDIKTFFRDPVQWSQFLLLFGLLAFYVLNLRTLNYDGRNLFWKNIIAFLNLGATALTMTTFASRFVFPLLSLEGRRFWVLGVSPVPKRSILLGKFVFSLFGLLVASESLICISCYMLKVPLEMALVHCITMVFICIGISGLAVGLGAMYPNFREDNPSKIVAGFGGTLNLVLSLLFIMLIIVIEAIASHVWFVGAHTQGPDWLWLALVSATAISVIVCWIPMHMGIRAFNRLEF